ncbi:32 kDa beta-galactoside-binding lectin-like [Musca autumnalis]|uniref:32 kDa beta-galactoside-binding lectin-like n=1 Tax=Musca autumnalis TaxID=221902 RepID=UPI003CF73E35
MSKSVFHSNFAEHLRFGHCFEICGKAKDGAKRFHISLCTEPGENRKIGLHFVADFETNQIMLGKFLNNDWCEEEFFDYETSQLLEEFKLYIALADGKFHLSLNGVALASYSYSTRLSLLTEIDIMGDLEYLRQMDHRKYFPYIWPPIQIVEDRIQFSSDVPMPFEPGHVMIISAHLDGNENGRFIVHLRNIWDMERQELHLSVRFDTRTVVRTSKTIPEDEHYCFDKEDEDSFEFPFEDFFKPFKLAFAFMDNELKIAKDGLFLCRFEFRTLNVVPFVGGLKIFGIDGVQVKVNELEHIKTNPMCSDFETYSQ